MDKIEKLVGNIFKGTAFVCMVTLVAWVFIIVIYIIGRIFGIGWMFVEEYVGYWLVFMAYIPLAYTLMMETHIKVELVTRRLPWKIRCVLQLCTDGIGLLIVCYLVWRSVDWLINGLKSDMHSATSLHTLLWPTFLLVPVGLTLFALAFTITLRRSVIELMRTEQKTES